MAQPLNRTKRDNGGRVPGCKAARRGQGAWLPAASLSLLPSPSPRPRRCLSAVLPLLLCALLAASVVAAPRIARAQELGLPNSVILVVDPNQLFSDTRFGRRVAAEIEAESVALSAENRRIESELADEERALTEARPGMDPEAFRDMADAFDAKVQRIRGEQEAKAVDLAHENDTVQRRFLSVARPVLEELMRESGAAVLLDTRAVLLSSDAVNVTDEAVRRIDLAIGDGAASDLPDPGAPAQPGGNPDAPVLPLPAPPQDPAQD